MPRFCQLWELTKSPRAYLIVGMDLLARAKSVFTDEIGELSAIEARLDGSIVKAVELIRDSLKSGGKLVITGIGKSGHIGNKIAATMNSTGTTSVVLSTQDALHGDLGIVRDGDVCLALSHSGETAELLSLLPFLKRFDIKLIGMTGRLDSSLAKYSDVVLDTAVSREACPLNLAPTSSSTAMLVMGDALAMTLLEAHGFTEKDFAKFHPGGSLGKALLTHVADIMRKDEAVAFVKQDDTVHDALTGMTRSKTGACIVTDENGFLAGIFTHGDFVRSYQNDPLIGNQQVSGFMTVSPISINQNSLAAEAIQIFGAHRIDEIVVLDEEKKPVGIVDTQDLARLKMI